MPNIENLRKQAKRIVRWHREGHHPVAELIRLHLTAFGEMSDVDILAHRFQLIDAQELIAKQQGFPSWQALLQGANDMSEQQPINQSSTAFKRAEPQLFTTDLVRSLTYYNEKLGFETKFAYGDPPFYAQVGRGEAHINLRWVELLPFDPAARGQDDLLAATICVESIKELFLDYQAKGADFKQTLRTEPWGARTFIIADPDGNLVLFAE